MDKQRFREMKHAAGICYCDFTPVLIVALASVIGACYLATIHEALNLAERLKTLPEGVIRSPSSSPGEAFTCPPRPARRIGTARCSPVAIWRKRFWRCNRGK